MFYDNLEHANQGFSILSPASADRFFDSTRGRIVVLLRLSPRTTEELARELGLTDNAIRAHIATLERDDLVRPSGSRRLGRVGKPATVYHLALEAEPLFSKAYRPLLTSLLGALAERLDRREMASLLREAGRRLAPSRRPFAGDLEQRVRLASDFLNQLGGLTTVEPAAEASGFLIKGHGCPLGTAVAERAEVCQALGGLIEEMTGARVRSCCSSGDRPSCCFEARLAV